MNKITIRKVELGDLANLTILCKELGYPAREDQVLKRLKKLLKSSSEAVRVAAEKTEVIGWIHVFISFRLESDPFPEIGGLVVSSKYRNKGIGKLLVKAAEKWAQEKGFTKIRVRSRIERSDAKRFYEREGYLVKKSQNVFEKSLT